MQVRTKLAVLSLSFALLSVGAVSAQDEKKPEINSVSTQEQEQMDGMMKAMAPGEMHKQIAKLAGDWTFTNTMWMAPGQPAQESKGTMHAETILGGRYVQSVWKGSFMGQPFEGRATEGFDNVSKQYVSAWVDNMGTGIMYSAGTCEEGGKRCTTTGTSSDPSTGGTVTMKSVFSWVDDNTFKNEMYGNDPSGKEYKMMEIVAKRK